MLRRSVREDGGVSVERLCFLVFTCRQRASEQFLVAQRNVIRDV